jgi:hypothetical protein
MELTTEKIEMLLKTTLAIAKGFKEKTGYRKDFTSMAIALGPELEPSIIPLKWNTNREKEILMQSIAMTARQTGTVAVALVTDSRWCLLDKFAKYFHLPPIESMTLQEWQRQYHEILHGVYGGSMEYLPRELWGEGVVVAIKGPALEPRTVTATYSEGPNDTIKWEDGPCEGKEISSEIGILPNWWDEPTGKPN